MLAYRKNNNHSCCRRSAAATVIVAMVLISMMMVMVSVVDAQNALRRLRRNVLTLDAAATPLRKLLSFHKNDQRDLARMTPTRNSMFESIQHDNKEQQQKQKQGNRKVMVDREIAEMDLLERMLGGSMSM
jgi:sensor histidine kinase YesM